MFKRYWWMLLVMAPVGMMAGLLLAAVVTYVMPKKYESFAIIEVKPRTREAIEMMTTHQRNQRTPTEAEIVCPPEIGIIKSSNTLSKVADTLDLTNRWGVDRKSTLAILKGIVQTDNIKGTDLIQIRVMHTNKEDARDIAAAVAAAYRDHRMELHTSTVEKGILGLREALRQQEERLEEKRITMDTTRELHQRNDSLDKAESKQEALERSKDLTDYVDAKRDFETELSMLEQLKLNLVRGEIIQSLPNNTVVIHDEPVIADSPISPNVALNLVAGTFGGLLLSPFLALPLMWWMNRKSSRAVQAAGGF